MISSEVMGTAGLEGPPVVEEPLAVDGPPEPEEAAVGSLVPSFPAEVQGSQAPVSGHWYPLRLHLGQEVLGALGALGPLPCPLPLLFFF